MGICISFFVGCLLSYLIYCYLVLEAKKKIRQLKCHVKELYCIIDGFRNCDRMNFGWKVSQPEQKSSNKRRKGQNYTKRGG